jgi:hypothetical protein
MVEILQLLRHDPHKQRCTHFEFIGNELQRVISHLFRFVERKVCLYVVLTKLDVCASRSWLLSRRMARFEIITWIPHLCVFTFGRPPTWTHMKQIRNISDFWKILNPSKIHRVQSDSTCRMYEYRYSHLMSHVRILQRVQIWYRAFLPSSQTTDKTTSK